MNRMRSLARAFPGLASAYRGLRRLLGPAEAQPREQVFSEIFRSNAWGSEASVSGSGSDLGQTRAVREALPGLCAEHGITSLLDAPCGDFNWMRHTELQGIDYMGADIVPELVARNRARYGAPGRRFEVLDLCADALPEVDLILCRDCLVHLSYADIARALRNICRSGSRYLMTTTFTRRPGNNDIATGGWRPLDLTQAPFHFPAPIALVDERCTEEAGRYADKALGLWRVADVAAALEARWSA